MSRWLLILGLSGCSLALSGPDETKPRMQAQSCSDDKTPVAIDGIFATAVGLGGVAAASNNSAGGAVVLFGLSAVFIGSAVHGSRVVDRCREWQATLDVARNVPMPAPASAPKPPVEEQDEAPAPPPPTPKIVQAPPPPPPASGEDPWRDFWRLVP